MSAPEIIGVPGARPVVELGVGDTRIPIGLGRWDVSRWDSSAQWAGTEPSWFDISCFVHDIDLAVGRDRSMERWEVGSCTIVVDNETGWADMGQGPPPMPMALSLRPGRQLRVGISIDNGPTRWLWRGIIDDAEPSYEAGQDDTATIAAIDVKGEAGKVDLGKVEGWVGAGEAASTRIHRILDAAGWPLDLRDIAATSVTLLGTGLDNRAADLLDQAAESAGGVVYGDTRGYVVFKPREWQTYAPDIPPEATIGNVDTDVCPVGWERAFRRADIATRTVVGRPDERHRQFDDTANQILYGVETFAHTDLQADQDAQIDLLGQRWLEVMSADYMPRVAAVTIDAATSVAARDLAASVDPAKPSRYRCRHHRDDGAVVFDAEFLATGITHIISRDGWTCRIALDDAAPYQATGGRWDQSRWNQATWADAPALRAEVAALRAQLVGAAP